MTNEQNKALEHRFFEEQDRLKGALPEKLCASNYTFILGDDPAVDFTGHQHLAAMFYAAFPDLRQTIEDAVAEDDRVVVLLKAQGTHTGPFMHIPATGKPIAMSGMAILHIVDGKVAQMREVFDQLSMLQQLGVIPPMG